MNQSLKQLRESLNPARAALLAALFTLVLLAAAAGRLSGWYAGELLEERRAEIELDASVRANAISSSVSRRLLLLEGFAAFSEVMAAGHASESQMQFYVQTVFPTVDGIYALAVAPGGAIDFIFPIPDNEQMQGMSLLNSSNPSLARAAQRAAESGDVALVGPLDLGYAEPVLVGLTAIYNEGDVWGFVIIVADFDPVLSVADFSGADGSLQVALRSGSGLLLFGDPDTLKNDPVLRRVEYPDGAWQLAVAPRGGWAQSINAELQTFRAALLLIGLLLAAAVYMATQRQVLLSQTVEEKIQEAETASQVERSRLARELHDSVSQALYGIALGARTLRSKIVERHTADPALMEPIDYILSLSQGGLAEMRALLMGLRPEELDEHGLAMALGRLGDGLASRHQLAVAVDVGDEPALGLEQKVALYRIAQEATHNSVKHAQAGAIRLGLDVEDGWVRMEISDDGKGFEPGGEFPGHMGLKSMRERAELAGASFEIESAQGKGTLVRVALPLPGGNPTQPPPEP